MLATLAGAHPANYAAATAKVAVDGSFVLRVRFDLLAYMTDQAPHGASSAEMEAILDAPDAEITVRLREAQNRLRSSIEAETSLRAVEFPSLADLVAARGRESGRRLPVNGTAVLAGRLPKALRTIAFRFPAVLDTVILTTEFPYQEPVSEPVAPGERSRPLTVPSEEQTVAAAKALGLTITGTKPLPPRRRATEALRGANVPVTARPADSRPTIAKGESADISKVPSRTVPTPVDLAPKITEPAPTLSIGTSMPVSNDSGGKVQSPTEIVVGSTGETPMPPESSPARNSLQSLPAYVRLGFLHILPEGVDHILFVLGLVLVATRTKDLLSQVSAFTVAHSLTLGLALFGVVRLPERIVEPVIALSIAFVAIENVLAKRVGRWRLAAVFGFGLIHGLGFAGALQDLGLGRRDLLPALVGFNVGVELGQLSVVAMALGVLGFFRSGPKYREHVVVPASLLIAAVALFWTVQRVFG